MNNILYPKTEAFNMFAQKPVSAQNANNKNSVNPAGVSNTTVTTPSKNKKKIALGIGLTALACGALYYKVASKPLNLPKENPIIAASEKEFRAHIASDEMDPVRIALLKEYRKSYQKCLNSFVGKIHKKISSVQQFFQSHFFDY